MNGGHHNPLGSFVFQSRGVYLLDSLATRHAAGELWATALAGLPALTAQVRWKRA